MSEKAYMYERQGIYKKNPDMLVLSTLKKGNINKNFEHINASIYSLNKMLTQAAIRSKHPD